jgi:hypothetical protein
LDRCDRLRGRFHGLAARMLGGSHVAIASHLLTAGHFSRRHLRIRQTGKRGSCYPEGNQTEDQECAPTRHVLMLPAHPCCCKLDIAKSHTLFQDGGWPVLAFFARAGTMLPITCFVTYGAHDLHFITGSCYRRLACHCRRSGIPPLPKKKRKAGHPQLGWR